MKLNLSTYGKQKVKSYMDYFCLIMIIGLKIYRTTLGNSCDVLCLGKTTEPAGQSQY